jgi:uncharacterized repeat protein (TIGR01451 family)
MFDDRATHREVCMTRSTTPARAAVAFALALLVSGMATSAFAQVVTTCPAALETTQLFSFTGAPAAFTVPANVNSVRVIAVGADGGERTATNFAGGAGAIIEGTFAVTPGQVFTVIAGQAGAPGDLESGGGGASGAYLGTTLVMVAGAGGGDDNTGNGNGGTATTSGSNGGNPAGSNCNAGGLGGVGGAGGEFGELPLAPQTNACQTGNGGGGGGGLNAAGGTSAVFNANPALRSGPSGGGQCSIAGAAGGLAGRLDPTEASNAGAAGGFGLCGGGGGDHRESGGGGGYSGGGGGPEGQFPGGGGSFIAATATAQTQTAGANGGGSGRNGSVRVCYTTRADLGITKTNTPGVGPNDQAADTVTQGATTTYSIVVNNTGGALANGAVVRDPAPTNLNCSTASCSATGGAACPATTGAALVTALQSVAGVVVPTLPVGGALTFTLTCQVL